MVAEVVRLLDYTENARILTNPARKIFNGLARYPANSIRDSDPSDSNSRISIDSTPSTEEFQMFKNRMIRSAAFMLGAGVAMCSMTDDAKAQSCGYGGYRGGFSWALRPASHRPLASLVF